MIKLKDILTEISKEDFLKSLKRVGEFSPIQIAMKSRTRDKVDRAKARRSRINRGKCIHDENDAYEYPNKKKKSLLCKICMVTRYEPKKSKALFDGKCPHCLTYKLYYLPKDDRISILCGACHKRELGRNLRPRLFEIETPPASPEGGEVITPEEFHYYGNFVLNALMGRNPDEYYSQHQKDIDKVADILRARFGPKTGTTIYRGIILDPSEVHNGIVKAAPEIKYVSFSENIDVAIAFADPQNPMASFLAKLYPNKRGYIITEHYDPKLLLYHHSWSKIFSMENIFGVDAKILERQKEVILKPEPEYKVVPVAHGSSKGYWVGQ